MSDFVEILGISSVLVVITCLIYYEILRIAWYYVPRMKVRRPRFRVVFIVLAIFLGHTVAIWFYGISYWLLTHYADYGTLVSLISNQEYDGTFRTALYFSTITYSSLGYGEIIPKGPIRMIAGIQVVNGLVLIGWSVSFTYLAMERFWDMHHMNQDENDNR